MALNLVMKACFIQSTKTSEPITITITGSIGSRWAVSVSVGCVCVCVWVMGVCGVWVCVWDVGVCVQGCGYACMCAHYVCTLRVYVVCMLCVYMCVRVLCVCMCMCVCVCICVLCMSRTTAELGGFTNTLTWVPVQLGTIAHTHYHQKNDIVEPLTNIYTEQTKEGRLYKDPNKRV